MQRRDDIVVGPEELMVLRGVFDATSNEIVSEYDTSPTSIEIARIRWANEVLSARHGISDPAMIKAVVLHRMVKWRRESRVAL
jgi:hypothetical protein